MEKSQFDKLLDKCVNEEDIRHLIDLSYKDKARESIFSMIIIITVIVCIMIIIKSVI